MGETLPVSVVEETRMHANTELWIHFPDGARLFLDEDHEKQNGKTKIELLPKHLEKAVSRLDERIERTQARLESEPDEAEHELRVHRRTFTGIAVWAGVLLDVAIMKGSKTNGNSLLGAVALDGLLFNSVAVLYHFGIKKSVLERSRETTDRLNTELKQYLIHKDTLTGLNSTNLSLE